MNIRNSKIFFIVIGVVSLLNACVEVDKTLGLDLRPDNAMMDVEQMEIFVPVYTAHIDSVITSSTSVGAVGYLNHEVFGLFTAGSVFRMLPYNLGFSYGDGAVLDSAVLTIYVSSRTQLDTTGLSQPLSLYRLNYDLKYSTAYYSNSLKPGDYNTANKISETYTYKGEDTIRIRLTDVFANEFLTASTEAMASDSVFLKTFKGFYLKAEDSETAPAGSGQVSYFDLTKAHLVVNYHTPDTTAVSYYFIEQGTPNFNVYTHSFSTVDDPLAPPSAKVYLEGLAGVKPYINFDHVKDSIEHLLAGKDLSKLAISKAELVVPVDYPASLLDLCPTALTLAYAADSTYTFLTDTYFESFGGALNRSLQQYSFNLTYYVQGMFNDQKLYHTAERKMYLYPIYSSYDSYGSEIKLLERNYYTCGVIVAPDVKLKLTYTMLK
jgi:hypothetical protein